MQKRACFFGLLFSLFALLSCATPPKGPAPLPGEEILLCFGAACPSRALLEKAQTRIGTAEIALGRSSGPALAFESLSGAAGVEEAWQQGMERGVAVILLADGGGNWRVFAMTPTLKSLLAGVIEPLDTGSLESDLAVAVLSARADRALLRGDAEGARRLGLVALSAAKKPPVCAGAGALRYLVWHTGNSDDETSEEAVACLDACRQARVKKPAERQAQIFLSTLSEVLQARAGEWKEEEMPNEWQGAQARARVLKDMRGRAASLRGPRRELVEALLNEMEATFLVPDDPCDEATPVRKVEMLKLAAETLVRLGRRDLSSGHLGPWVDEAGRLDPEYLRRLQADMDKPEHAWLRQDHLANLLIALAVTRSDPSTASPFCKEFLVGLKRMAKQDTWPGAFDRNLARLSGGFTAAGGICTDRSPLQNLLEEMLAEAAKDERGRIAVLEVLTGMSFELFAAMFSGQQTKLQTTLLALRDALKKQLNNLGSSPDELSFGAVLKVLLSAEPFLLGDMPKALKMLHQAEAQLAGLPFPPKSDALVLARVAPAIHLGVIYLVATVEKLTGEDAKALGLLAKASSLTQRNLPVAMAALDAEVHAPAAVEFLAGLDAIVGLVFDSEAAGDKAKLALASKAVDRARHVMPKQGDWWDVGLGIAGVVLCDVYALFQEEALGTQAKAKLMEQAREDLKQIAEVTMARFAEGERDWDSMLLLPALHRVMEDYLGQDQTEAEWGPALKAAWPDAESVLTRLAKERGKPERWAALAERGGMIAVFLEGLQMVKAVGLDSVLAGDKKAREQILSDLSKIDLLLENAGRHVLRMYLEFYATALLVHMKDEDGAMSWLARAGKTAELTSMARYRHYIDLMAVTVREHFDNQDGALAAMLALIQRGDGALACNKAHEVHALLPQLARLLRNKGRKDEATKTLALYERLVAEGFFGEGQLTTQYKFHYGSYLFQLPIVMSLSNLVQSTGSEGSFQLGMGAQNHKEKREFLKADGGIYAQPRHDRLLNAQLQRAFFVLLDGEDAQADRVMQRALNTLRLIQHGHSVTLNVTQAGGLADSREHFYVPLLAWTGVLAQLRGHHNLGGEFMSRAWKLAQEKGLDDPFALEDDFPPAYLGDFAAREPLRLFLRAWRKNQPELNGWSVDMRMAADHLLKGQPDLLPAWGMALAEANHLFNLGKTEDCDKKFATLTAVPRVRALRTFNQGISVGGKWPKPEALSENMEQLLAAGYCADVALMVQSMVMMASYKRGPAEPKGLAIKLLKRDEHVLGPALRGTLELTMAQLAFNEGRQGEGLDWLVAGLKHGLGRSPVAEQAERDLLAINLALKLGRHELSDKLMDEGLPRLIALRGWQDPMVYRYQVLQMAVAVLLGKSPAAEKVKTMHTTGASLHGVENLRQFLQALEMALSTGEAAKDLCKDFLKIMLKDG